MADLPVPSLTRAREVKISELSTFFANDDLSIEDLERRIERVYKASSVAELDAITADLASAPTALGGDAHAGVARAGRSASLPASYDEGSSRLLSLMSSTRRVGRWAVPPRLDVVAVMSDTKIDMRQATLSAGVTTVELRSLMASVRIVVPPHVRVVNEIHAVMASVVVRVDDGLARDEAAMRGAPIVRLTGYALMADVKIVVRGMGQMGYGTDDEDDD